MEIDIYTLEELRKMNTLDGTKELCFKTNLIKHLDARIEECERNLEPTKEDCVKLTNIQIDHIQYTQIKQKGMIEAFNQLKEKLKKSADTSDNKKQ